MFICRGPGFQHHSPPDQSPVLTPLHLISTVQPMTEPLRAHNRGALFRSCVSTAISPTPLRSNSKWNTWASSKALTDRWWQGSCQTEHTDEIRISPILWGVTNQFGGIWTCSLPRSCCTHDVLKTIWLVYLTVSCFGWVVWVCHWVPWPKMLYNYHWGWGQRGVLRSLHSQFKRVRNRRGTTHMLQGATWGV